MAQQDFTPVLPSSACRGAAAVTPHVTNDLPKWASRGLYIGVAGDVKVDMIESGTAITFKAVPVGILRVGVKHVYATGTTATDIVALF